MSKYDCLVIVTHHKYLDGTAILEAGNRIVDTRNLTGRQGTLSDKVLKL